MTATITELNIEELVNLDDHIPCAEPECPNEVKWRAHHHNRCHVFICDEHRKKVIEFRNAAIKGNRYILCQGCNTFGIHPEDIQVTAI